MKDLRAPHSLESTTLLITGAAGGIGTAAAKLCSGLDAQLVLTDLHVTDALRFLADSLPGVQVVQVCDVTQRQQVEDLVGRHPNLSALIDTVGNCPYDEDWLHPDWNEQAFIQVNVLGPINWARALLPQMIARGYGGHGFLWLSRRVDGRCARRTTLCRF